MVDNIRDIFLKFKGKKNLGLKAKILLPTILIIMTGYISSTIMSINQINKMSIDSGMQQASLASEFVANTLNADYVKTMQKGSEGSPIYLKLYEDLSRIISHDEFDAAYAILKDKNGDFVYALDSTKESAIGDVVDFDLEQIEYAFEGYPVTNNFIEEYEGSYIITSYYPMIDSSGKVSSVIGVDYNAVNLQNTIDANVQRSIILSVIFVSGAAIIITVLLSLTIRSIKKVGNKLDEIAGISGDLTQTVEVKSNDEVGNIAHILNKLLSKLNDMMCSINTVVQNVNNSTNSINDSCVSTNDNIALTSASLEEISATMDIVNSTIIEVRNMFNSVVDKSDKMMNLAVDETKHMEDVISNVDVVYNSSVKAQQDALLSADKLETEVRAKIKESEAIKEIEQLTVKVLEIASQTRLLSLNASIEAARAGEAGRGFSVVAHEIGNLSEQSAIAANEIQEISRIVMEAVKGLTEQSEKLVKFSKDITNTGYTKLLDLATEFRDVIQEVGSDLQTFANTSSELNNNVVSVNENINVVTESVNQCNTAITEVNVSIEDIMQSTGKILDDSNVNLSNIDNLIEYLNTFKFKES